MPSPGAKVGRYTLTRRIASGGMGEVWEAVDPGLDRIVAAKLIFEHLAVNPDFQKRFRREARTVAKLEHPHIVKIYDFDDQECRWLIMPLLLGGSLGERLQAEQPPEVCLSWLDSIAQALDFAHNKGIIHRDLKPANVLFGEHGGLYVVDFGLARSMDDTQMTSTGASMGTVGFMPPEQIRGAADARSDQYALAVIAFRMLVGCMPFTGATRDEVLIKTLTEPPLLPTAVRRTLPPGLDAVFARALGKQPAGRYPSCSDLVRTIRTSLCLGATEPLMPSAPYRQGHSGAIGMTDSSRSSSPSTRSGNVEAPAAVLSSIVRSGRLARLFESSPSLGARHLLVGSALVLASASGVGLWRILLRPNTGVQQINAPDNMVATMSSPSPERLPSPTNDSSGKTRIRDGPERFPENRHTGGEQRASGQPSVDTAVVIQDAKTGPRPALGTIPSTASPAPATPTVPLDKGITMPASPKATVFLARDSHIVSAATTPTVAQFPGTRTFVQPTAGPLAPVGTSPQSSVVASSLSRPANSVAIPSRTTDSRETGALAQPAPTPVAIAERPRELTTTSAQPLREGPRPPETSPQGQLESPALRARGPALPTAAATEGTPSSSSAKSAPTPVTRTVQASPVARIAEAAIGTSRVTESLSAADRGLTPANFKKLSAWLSEDKKLKVPEYLFELEFFSPVNVEGIESAIVESGDVRMTGITRVFVPPGTRTLLRSGPDARSTHVIRFRVDESLTVARPGVFHTVYLTVSVSGASFKADATVKRLKER